MLRPTTREFLANTPTTAPLLKGPGALLVKVIFSEEGIRLLVIETVYGRAAVGALQAWLDQVMQDAGERWTDPLKQLAGRLVLFALAPNGVVKTGIKKAVTPLPRGRLFTRGEVYRITPKGASLARSLCPWFRLPA